MRMEQALRPSPPVFSRKIQEASVGVNYQITAFSKVLAIILFLCGFVLYILYIIFIFLVDIPEIVSSNYILFCTSHLNSVRSLIHHMSNPLDRQAVANVEFWWRMSHSEEGDHGHDANAQIKELVSSTIQQCRSERWAERVITKTRRARSRHERTHPGYRPHTKQSYPSQTSGQSRPMPYKFELVYFYLITGLIQLDCLDKSVCSRKAFCSATL